MKKPAKRKFAPISPADLNAKIEARWEECDNNDCAFVESFGRDIKVEFDTENFEPGTGYSYRELDGLYGDNKVNGFQFRGMTAGGDWEHPVFFIVYWDGKKLRAYVPSDGNPWNKQTMKAIGNEEEEIDSDAASDYAFEPKAILGDIRERFDLLVAPKDLPIPRRQRLASLIRALEKCIEGLKELAEKEAE